MVRLARCGNDGFTDEAHPPQDRVHNLTKTTMVSPDNTDNSKTSMVSPDNPYPLSRFGQGALLMLFDYPTESDRVWLSPCQAGRQAGAWNRLVSIEYKESVVQRYEYDGDSRVLTRSTPPLRLFLSVFLALGQEG